MESFEKVNISQSLKIELAQSGFVYNQSEFVKCNYCPTEINLLKIHEINNIFKYHYNSNRFCDVYDITKNTSISDLFYQLWLNRDQMYSEITRLNTFNDCILDIHVKKKLAEAGCYNSFDLHKIFCAFCEFSILEEKITDKTNVYIEHFIFNDKCDIFDNNKDTINVPIDEHIMKTLWIQTYNIFGNEVGYDDDGGGGANIIGHKVYDLTNPLRFEQARLDSFKYYNPCSFKKYRLAEAGFVYTSTPRMNCIFCDTTIDADEYNNETNFLEVHFLQRRDCPIFQTDVNVPIDKGLYKIILREIPNITDKILTKRNVCFTKLEHSDYNDLDKRSNSFPINWSNNSDYSSSSSSSSSSEESYLSRVPLPLKRSSLIIRLAEAGFFYDDRDIGANDAIRCFCCGLILKWDMNDIPIVMHAKYLNKCEYILSLTGYEFIMDVKNGFITNESFKISPVTFQEEIKYYPNDVDEGTPCKICYINRSNIVLLPCKHCVLCNDCIRKLKNKDCPICRRKIYDHYKIYFG